MEFAVFHYREPNLEGLVDYLIDFAGLYCNCLG